MIILVTLNGTLHRFEHIENVREKVKEYGKDLDSIRLSISQDGENFHDFSILSACNIISSCKIPKKVYQKKQKIIMNKNESLFEKIRKYFVADEIKKYGEKSSVKSSE